MHGHKRVRPGAAILALAATVPWMLCSACMVYQPRVNRPPTLGEELIQLDQARKDGLLTDAEYDARRVQLIAAWKDIAVQPIEQIAPYGGTPVPSTPSVSTPSVSTPSAPAPAPDAPAPAKERTP